MSELIQRIGILLFIQIIIESWNGVFLLIMIFSMILGKRLNRSNRFMNKVKIPLLYSYISI